MFYKWLKNGAVLFLVLCVLSSIASCSADTTNNAPPVVETARVETQAPEATLEPTLTSTPEALDIPAIQDVTGALEIFYLDVGQGDCIYIMLPNGETVLIDAGEATASGDILKSLKDNNDKRIIDYVIATHPHSDHIGGMAAILEDFAVKNIWMPDAIHTTETFEGLLDIIAAKGLKIQIAEAGKILFDYGNLKAEFLAPCGSSYSDLNNYSAVLLLTYNDRRFLFMGDAESESEAEILATGRDIFADVLKVGHHGSSTSTTKVFIENVSPQYAVISCGIGNSYGHPTSQTLSTLEEYGVDVKRTDELGIVVFYCDDTGKISFTAIQTKESPRAPTPTPTIESSEEKETPSKTKEPNLAVYITNTGAKYHRDGCRYLNKSKISIELEDARQSYEACSVCDPPR